MIFVRCRRPSASALAVSFAAAMTGAASISHWGSSPLCGWNGILSFLCRCMIIVCRRRSAPAGIRMIRAACSATSHSLWANFSRPILCPCRRITRRQRISAPAVINRQRGRLAASLPFYCISADEPSYSGLTTKGGKSRGETWKCAALRIGGGHFAQPPAANCNGAAGGGQGARGGVPFAGGALYVGAAARR